MSLQTQPSVADLSAFQRDVLWILATNGPQYGLEIKARLDGYYDADIYHGRLYPNLDALVDEGFVAKSKRDKRTNDYSLTEAGRRALSARQSFQEGIGDA